MPIVEPQQALYQLCSKTTSHVPLRKHLVEAVPFTPTLIGHVPLSTRRPLTAVCACRQVVHLSKVTLSVEERDFLALLSAARRGPRWQSGAEDTAYIIDGISVFRPRQFNQSSLLLEEYRCALHKRSHYGLHV